MVAIHGFYETPGRTACRFEVEDLASLREANIRKIGQGLLIEYNP
jgi:hypothetical protein